MTSALDICFILTSPANHTTEIGTVSDSAVQAEHEVLFVEPKPDYGQG